MRKVRSSRRQFSQILIQLPWPVIRSTRPRKAEKRAAVENRISGPRPLYIRHTTFGQEAILDRPVDFESNPSTPLRRISGNVQSSSSLAPSASLGSSEPTLNPFNWEPENTLATRPQQTTSRAGPRRKGRSRSSVVRLTLLPPQYASPLPEDPEEESPLRASDPAKITASGDLSIPLSTT